MIRYRIIITGGGQQLLNEVAPFTSYEKARRYAWMHARRLRGYIATLKPEGVTNQ